MQNLQCTCYNSILPAEWGTTMFYVTTCSNSETPIHTALTLHKRNGQLTWHVTIVSYKTHKWKQLDSVLKGQTSYWSQDTL
jgi:hypothetical protein